jgi:hypothetical protein
MTARKRELQPPPARPYNEGLAYNRTKGVLQHTDTSRRVPDSSLCGDTRDEIEGRISPGLARVYSPICLKA